MNRLQNQSSPYLLQHAHNPVDWYPWGPEAFKKAITENKLILVSIGYSTCHWCHVMERESFEDENMAAFMNKHFVNIKVDREERPDVDQIYMEAIQLLTGSGGWPLNCFLTPEKKPFYGGTYFPPRPAYNRPSWLQVLQHMVHLWENDQQIIFQQANKLFHTLQKGTDHFISSNILEPGTPIDKTFLDKLHEKLKDKFDTQFGGFGGAPKFPSTFAFDFLLRWYYYKGDRNALQHVQFSLDKMIRGGIYDQIGGGFSRYATDRAWLIPHFEKMLYDNALIVTVLADLYKLDGNPLWKEAIERTLNWVEREMTAPDNTYFAALDADSEGEEGKFYIWEPEEWNQILGEDALWANLVFGIRPGGNWEGKHILTRPLDLASLEQETGMKKEALREKIGALMQKLMRTRDQRIRPGLDTKVILSWNALQISAYCKAYEALGQAAYKEKARKAHQQIKQIFQNENGRLNRIAGKHPQPATLEDYASYIASLIDYYRISLKQEYLNTALHLTNIAINEFYDEEDGLFFYATKQEDLIFRPKEVLDNAIPSGNSTMVSNLTVLGLAFDIPDLLEKAERMLQVVREAIEKYPQAFPRWASQWLTFLHGLPEVTAAGPNAAAMMAELSSSYIPEVLPAALDSTVNPENQSGKSVELPFAAQKLPFPDGTTALYLCKNKNCLSPVKTLKELWQLLENKEETH